MNIKGTGKLLVLVSATAALITTLIKDNKRKKEK
jgi:hypothetical protein